MILYWEGKQYPLTLWPADVLFIAGRLQTKPRAKLPFEHAALVAATHEVRTPQDLLHAPVYGVPESVSHRRYKDSGIVLKTAEWWIRHDVLTDGIGSEVTVWNFASRYDQFDASKARYMEKIMRIKAETVRFRYDPENPQFQVDPSLMRDEFTNCVGFACSMLEHFKTQILDYRFPEYASPYTYDPRRRKFPSPGHLAHALRLPSSRHPYLPKHAREAQAYAKVLTTFRYAVKHLSQTPRP